MKFEELNLNSETLQIIHNTNSDEANPFQEAVLKTINGKRNLVLKAGESNEELNAVAVAALDQAHRTEDDEGTSVLVLTNSEQTLKAVQELVTQLKPDCDCIAIEANGDTEVQSKIVEEGHKIVFANPGQLHTILRKNRYIFRDIELLVFLEFDEMVSAQLQSTLANIKKRILCDCVSVVVTKEYKGQIKRAVSSLINKPVIQGFGPAPAPPVPSRITQNYIKVPPRMKISTLLAHLQNYNSGNAIIFTDSKRGTDKLYRIFKKQRMNAVSLHYKLSEERRVQRFANFVSGNVQYLLVSDISASQLDVTGVTRVVNYDVPASADEYRYRTALLGGDQNNEITSLVSKQDQSDINKLQNELGEVPSEIPLPDKVKQKLKERKQKKNNDRNRRSNNHQKEEDLSLPRPSYDQLKGGRNGSYKDEEAGIVNFFKKLFS